jgi:hypothetical protein
MPKTVKSIALGIIGDIVSGIDKAFFGFTDVFDALVEASEQAKNELQSFKNFDFNPDFKTRVISVPIAVQAAEDLWQSFRVNLIDKLEQIAREVEELPGILKSLPKRGPGEPLLQHTALVVQVIHASNEKIAALIRQVLDFTSTVDDIKLRLETLDDLFLQQKNPRQGRDPRRRVGKLHAEEK